MSSINTVLVPNHIYPELFRGSLVRETSVRDALRRVYSPTTQPTFSKSRIGLSFTPHSRVGRESVHRAIEMEAA